MPSGYDVCVMYTALKLHFTPGTYDYFKYHGKIKSITPQNFDNRKDKWFFHKISKLYSDTDELVFFMAANFLGRPVVWVRDLLTEESREIYLDRKRIQESLEYLVVQDIEKLGDAVQFKSLLQVSDGQIPPLMNLALQGEIMLETLIVLNAMIGFFPIWEKKIADTIIFPTFKHRCERYAPFLKIDAKKFRRLLLSRLTIYK
jgi:hypothetical protein